MGKPEVSIHHLVELIEVTKGMVTPADGILTAYMLTLFPLGMNGDCFKEC